MMTLHEACVIVHLGLAVLLEKLQAEYQPGESPEMNRLCDLIRTVEFWVKTHQYLISKVGAKRELQRQMANAKGPPKNVKNGQIVQPLDSWDEEKTKQVIDSILPQILPSRGAIDGPFHTFWNGNEEGMEFGQRFPIDPSSDNEFTKDHRLVTEMLVITAYLILAILPLRSVNTPFIYTASNIILTLFNLRCFLPKPPAKLASSVQILSKTKINLKPFKRFAVSVLPKDNNGDWQFQTYINAMICSIIQHNADKNILPIGLSILRDENNVPIPQNFYNFLTLAFPDSDPIIPTKHPIGISLSGNFGLPKTVETESDPKPKAKPKKRSTTKGKKGKKGKSKKSKGSKVPTKGSRKRSSSEIEAEPEAEAEVPEAPMEAQAESQAESPEGQTEEAPPREKPQYQSKKHKMFVDSMFAIHQLISNYSIMLFLGYFVKYWRNKCNRKRSELNQEALTKTERRILNSVRILNGLNISDKNVTLTPEEQLMKNRAKRRKYEHHGILPQNHVHL
jgi:hypothetical protein